MTVLASFGQKAPSGLQVTPPDLLRNSSYVGVTRDANHETLDGDNSDPMKQPTKPWKPRHGAALALVCLLIFQPCDRSFADAKGMPEADAVYLLIEYLRSQGYDTKEAPLDLDRFTDPADKGFYAYDIHASGPHDYYGHIGTYAVNAETGDIWDTGLCRRLDTGAIAPLEDSIRYNRGLSKSEFERKKKPRCLND